MTNEEKAQELAIKYWKDIGCAIACCEMAEWKEQQMIEKACEWLEEFTTDYVNDTRLGFSKKEFIGDFRKAMDG